MFLDLDVARTDPSTVEEARERLVFWSTKETYAKADVKVELDRYEWDCKANRHPEEFRSAFLSTMREIPLDMKMEQRVAEAKWSEKANKNREEHQKRVNPLRWLEAEAKHYRIVFTHWVTAFNL